MGVIMEDENGGLLNWIGSPEGQGLLATVFGGLAGSRKGEKWNSIGRAGMSGITGYGNALDRNAAKKQDDALVNVAPGGTLFNPRTNTPVFTSPIAPKEANKDAKIEQFEYAQKQGYTGTFPEFIAINANIMADANAALKDSQVNNINAENAYNLPRPRTIKPPSVRAPMPGQIMDGYKFKGGNPSDQNNWEKQ